MRRLALFLLISVVCRIRLRNLLLCFISLLVMINATSFAAEKDVASSIKLKQQIEQERVVVVKGVASCGDMGFGKCKNAALEQAKRNAAEQGSAVIIDSLTEMDNFIIQSDQVRSRFKAIILNYEVIDQGLDGESGFFYNIRATIKGQIPADFDKPDGSADLGRRIDNMLKDGQQVALYKDRGLGRAVISIGFAQHSNQNVAIDMAKQEAMKYLASFLKGEQVSATSVAEQKYIGDLVEETYYQNMQSTIDASLKAAYFYKSGRYEGSTYSVVIISEKSNVAADYFKSKESQNVILAKGFSSLSEGIAKARNKALNQALRSAVEQYAGVQMASKTSIENAEQYKGKLASVSKGFVKRYEIKKEYQEDGNYIIEIIAEVSEEDPDSKSSMEAIKESMGRPSFFIKGDDQRLQDMINQVLSDNELDITPDKNRAKYIINSKVKKHEYSIPSSNKMKGLQTTITIRVVDKYSGDDFINIANDPENSIEISASDEVRERNSYSYAMEELKDKLIKEIRKHFVSTFSNGTKVTVKLVDFDRMSDVNELKECIDSLSLTKSVSVSPVEGRTVTYEVLYLGNPSDLQLDIMKKSREYRLKGLIVKSNKDGQIWFTF